MSDLYTRVREAVTHAAGISVNAALSAVDGSRHVLPPTYADAPHKHNMTEPDAHGVAAWVSIDSPASFANRIEDKLVRANLGLDPLRVQVAGQTLSTMQMPHRAFDAILRDSLLDGTPFRKPTSARAGSSAASSRRTASTRSPLRAAKPVGTAIRRASTSASCPRWRQITAGRTGCIRAWIWGPRLTPGRGQGRIAAARGAPP